MRHFEPALRRAPACLAAPVAALMLVAALVSIAGCAAPADEGASQDEAATQEAAEAQESTEAAETDLKEYLPQSELPESWDQECFDRHGDVSAYAVAELTGAELETLLQQQGYAWNESNRIWLKDDGSSAVVVRGARGVYLSDDRIAALGAGSAEGSAYYELVTSGYASPERVVDGLVAQVLEVEDVVYSKTAGVGVVGDPTGARMLVLVAPSNDVYLLSVFSEAAVAAGLLDQAAGASCGTTVDEAFAALAGAQANTGAGADAP